LVYFLNVGIIVHKAGEEGIQVRVRIKFILFTFVPYEKLLQIVLLYSMTPYCDTEAAEREVGKT